MVKRLAALLLAGGLGVGAQAEPRRVASLRPYAELQGTVRAVQPNAVLGDLLERWQPAGVELRADDRIFPISGYRLAIRLRPRPLWQAMDAVRRLYSTRHDPWYWTAETVSAGRRFVLHNTIPPAAFGPLRQQFVEDFCLQQQRKKRAFYAASPAQQMQMAAQDQYYKAMAASPRSKGFYSFHADLSEDAIRSILRGKNYDIKWTDLTEAQRGVVRSEYRLSHLEGRPGVVQADELDKVTLLASPGGELPSMFLKMGEVGGYSVLGGMWLQDALRDAGLKDWVAPDETRTAGDQSVPAPNINPLPNETRIQGPLDLTAFRLSRLADLDLLYDRARSGGSTTSADRTLTGPLPVVLAYLDSAGVLWKKWGSIYLMRPADAETASRLQVVPWPVLRLLRKHAAANRGFLTPGDWYVLAGLRSEQREELTAEFPDAGALRFHIHTLRLVGALPERDRVKAAAPDGVTWDDLSSVGRRAAEGVFGPRARTLRLVLRWSEGITPTVTLGVSFGDRRPPVSLVLQPRVPPQE